ncbi:MAG: hypothetical protein JWP59_102 [Massilia sp.]|nr:hypothetical protein [Massilia sp.]
MNKAAAWLALSALLWITSIGEATAKPAPWFSWRSKLTGATVCSQTPLGAGWEKWRGPYRDSHCAKLVAHE